MIPGRHKSFLSLSKCPDWHSVLPSFISPEVNQPGHEVTSHLHLVPKLKKSGAIHLFSLYVLMARTVTTLLLPTSIIREFLIFERCAYVIIILILILLLLLIIIIQIQNIFIFM